MTLCCDTIEAHFRDVKHLFPETPTQIASRSTATHRLG
jgi:hypothetical protein